MNIILPRHILLTIYDLYAMNTFLKRNLCISPKDTRFFMIVVTFYVLSLCGSFLQLFVLYENVRFVFPVSPISAGCLPDFCLVPASPATCRPRCPALRWILICTRFYSPDLPVVLQLCRKTGLTMPKWNTAIPLPRPIFEYSYVRFVYYTFVSLCAYARVQTKPPGIPLEYRVVFYYP